MEQRCQIILQNYLKTCDITDYKIINVNVVNYVYFIINYKYKSLFCMISIDNYLKYNINNTKNNILKEYKHNEYIYYYNNKNIYINLYFLKNNINLFKIIFNNNKEYKYYNKFFKMYKKINYFYALDICFMYYYSIKTPYIIYIYKKYEYNTLICNIIDLYSNQYSIMYLII